MISGPPLRLLPLRGGNSRWASVVCRLQSHTRGADQERLAGQAEIRTINAETAPDVERWFANAKALEEDIARSKALANDIVRQSEAPDASGKTILEAEETVAFLSREVRYNRQVLDVLGAIQHVGGLLDQVEQARQERRIIDSLHLLERKTCRLTPLSALRCT